MRWAFAVVLLVHGLIHVMGFARAFELAELTALTQPISRAHGVVWLVAGGLFVASGALFVGSARGWWELGAIAVVLSQIAIVWSWSDAKYGTLVNALVLVAVVLGALLTGPTSLRAEYEREVAQGLSALEPAPTEVLDAARLAAMPAPVRRYLEQSGAARCCPPSQLRARFHGRIRGGPSAPWMPFVAEQRSFLRATTRLFFMEATMYGVPAQVLHVFDGGHASMRVRALGAIPIASASGPEMTRAETVTMLNDVCVLAPGAMLDPAIRCEPIDERHARVTFTHAGDVVSAELTFDAEGWLTDFVSDDRLMTVEAGAMRPCRWWTPLRDVKRFGPMSLASRGEGIWHPESGPYAYLEITIDELVLEG